MVELLDHQKLAISRLGNGKILWGGVGTGKSLTAIGYYMEREYGRDIVVITTAKKRDSLEWEGEAVKFGISTAQEFTCAGSLIVESWNNIKKFEDFENCFFIFDEQRLVGTQSWVKSFLKIARKNRWILLTATPGDTWLDYAAVFVANGFYDNITQFKRSHVIYEAWSKYPRVKGYIGENRLEALRNDILVEMPFIKHTNRIINYWDVDYDKELFDKVWKRRWNVFTDEPIMDVGEMFRNARKVVNMHESRVTALRALLRLHDRVVVFYTFNYELELLRALQDEISVLEWNGHRKDRIYPDGKWVFLVQYTAGAEGWNCVWTNAMVMYSLTYSYKTFIQAQGRIDRLDTPYTDLFYYVFRSSAPIDEMILEALKKKRNFNERRAARNLLPKT